MRPISGIIGRLRTFQFGADCPPPMCLICAIAGGFVQSVEFQGKYGNLDDSAFVTELYLNVLNRTPAPSELNAWLGLIHNSGYTHDMVLIGFAESPENIAKDGGVADSCVNG